MTVYYCPNEPDNDYSYSIQVTIVIPTEYTCAPSNTFNFYIYVNYDAKEELSGREYINSLTWSLYSTVSSDCTDTSSTPLSTNSTSGYLIDVTAEVSVNISLAMYTSIYNSCKE